MLPRSLLCVLLLTALPLPAADPVELPVTRAVLFSSGVGYFEHSGSVEGDAAARLMFKTSQINDVLKSMVLTDQDGGTVNIVTYPSSEPLNRALGGFSVDISANPSLGDLLNQLRGAKVTAASPEPISGTILGVERHTKIALVGGQSVKVEEQVLNVVTETGIRPLPLANLQSIQLSDGKLQEELNKALMLLITSRDQDSKPVEIRFNGNGSRKVKIGYLVETPVWKTSYRLDLSGEKPFMQGWAIVENTSDADWKGVNLSMVSGQPISFIQDLYTPLYMPRPTVQPELYASLVPRRYEGGIDEMHRTERLAESSAGVRGGVAGRAMSMTAAKAMAAAPAAPPAAMPADLGLVRLKDTYAGVNFSSSGVQSVASASKLAELFRFTIANPVDLSRRRSAMLPIVNQQVAAEKVSIYNQSTLAKHPLNGVWLTNDTGLKLLGGPVTIFDGGAYAGDAQISHLSVGQKRLLSYAVDLETTVDPSEESKSAMTAVKIAKGVMFVTHKHQFTKTYAIASKAEAARKVVIEHPFTNGRKLIEPATFAEKNAEVYRFTTDLPAGKGGKFIVKEEQVEVQEVALMDQPADTLLFFIQQGAISDQARQALQVVVGLKQELSDVQRQYEALQQQVAEIQNGQQRLRENIKSVGPTSTLGMRYVSKLNSEEDQLEKLNTRIATLRQDVQAKQKALADHLAKLSVE